MRVALAGVVIALSGLAGCERKPAPEPREAINCAEPAARTVVEQFGQQLKQVSLTAPDSLVRQQVRESYAPFVTSALLDSWVAQPTRAPGRAVSSPWPDRIDIASVNAENDSTCVVQGQIAYITSAEQAPGAALQRVPVTLRIVKYGSWRVSAFEAAEVEGSTPDSISEAAPADVIRAYYAAINARDYKRAYSMWGDGGRSSRQTLEEFSAGFAQTDSVRVEIGTPGPIEGAAGSRYVEIPVVISATKTDGTQEHFRGKYTLRRSVVTGATEAQQHWHIDTADIARIK